jgi:hypothetical protein
MRHLMVGILFAAIALAMSATTTEAQNNKKPIKATKSWSGKKEDETLKIKAPATGFFTEAKAFDDLWKAWRPTEKTPEVDFKTSIVVVTLGSGPNIVRPSFTVNEAGNVTVLAISTLIGGPGFGYSLDVLPREGIKSIEGKAIDVK